MKIRMGLTALLIILSLVANAALKLPALVADHMVLQRNVVLPIWGWADAGEKIAIDFNGRDYLTTTDERGKWRIEMAALPAGGPYILRIKGKTQEILIKDILIGDVWICSGQSNMVYDFNQTRARNLYAKDYETSANDKIRQIVVNRITSSIPSENFETTGWKSASPKTLNGFSVAGYFFAKSIFEKYNVPIGLINSSWGGTKIESWTSESGLRLFPRFSPEIALLKDTVTINRNVSKHKELIKEWHLKNKTEDAGYSNGRPIWVAQGTDLSSWKEVVLPGLWDRIGEGNTYGVIWFRKEIQVPAELIGKEAIIRLGSVDDEDETLINGTLIGGYANRGQKREYKIPANTFNAGSNIITVRVINWNGNAGFVGDGPMQLDFGQEKIALEGQWKYRKGRKTSQIPGAYNAQDLPTSIFNGMISPLIPFAFKGVIWYQGENNDRMAYEYRALLPAMIEDWRTKWGVGNFPFIYQQLVNFKEPKNQPNESMWAELREAQLLTLGKSPNTAMAVGIDLGEAEDIHPVNKKDVGERLALGARKVAYGEKRLISSGPIYTSYRINGDKIQIMFKSDGDQLVSKGPELRYFAIAGADKKFVWAKAVIKKNIIEVSSPEVPMPVAVRYAWADNPSGCNLFNTSGLPASPFRTDDWPGITLTN